MQSPPAIVDPPRPLQQPADRCVLQTRALAGERGERRLFEGLDLDLPAGSVTWLRGRNGRGKTTLLRLLAGLASPAEGSIEVLGQPQRESGPDGRRSWVYIGHQNALKDDLTAIEALRFLARLHGLPADDAALTQALKRLGIVQRQHAAVRTLSQGQRRRVALARLALSAAAPLWLLDEPYDALDADGVEALNAVISAHADSGGCVLLTSHQALSITRPLPAVLDLEPFAPKAARGQAWGQAPFPAADPAAIKVRGPTMGPNRHAAARAPEDESGHAAAR